MPDPKPVVRRPDDSIADMGTLVELGLAPEQPEPSPPAPPGPPVEDPPPEESIA